MRNRSSLLVDTGFIYALFCKKDVNHQKAKEAAVKFNGADWVTTCFVFHELYWLLHETHRAALFQAEQAGIFHIVDFEKTQLREIEKHVQKYTDRQIDLADASLISLAEELGHGNILTTDINDFSVYRWSRTNSFTLLL